MANISGTNLAAPIVPFTTEDTFPTHHALYGKGGWRTVETIEERDNIPLSRLEEGCVVYVIEEKKPYTYKDRTWKEFVKESCDVSVVQSTGQSETSVMSQNAITYTLCKPPKFSSIIDRDIDIIGGSSSQQGGVVEYSSVHKCFVYYYNQVYYASWGADIENNISNPFEYNVYADIVTAVKGKLFICDNKLYTFDGSDLILISGSGGSIEIVQDTGNSTTAVMSQNAVTNAIGSVIPKFAGIINESSVTDGSPSDEANGEVFFNSATNTFILSVRGQGYFTNWSNIKDYMTEYGGTPLTNKIFEYLNSDTSDTNNKKQYIFNGTGLVLLSSGEKKQDKLEIIDLPMNQESYTIEPDKRYIISQIGENVTTTNIRLSTFEDYDYTKSYEIDFTTGENVGEIIISGNIGIDWIKDLEISQNTRYLISIDATTPENTLTAMYVTKAQFKEGD